MVFSRLIFHIIFYVCADFSVIWLYPLYYFGAWINSLENYPQHLMFLLRVILNPYSASFSIQYTNPSTKQPRTIDMTPSRKNFIQATTVVTVTPKGKGKTIDAPEPADRQPNLSDVRPWPNICNSKHEVTHLCERGLDAKWMSYSSQSVHLPIHRQMYANFSSFEEEQSWLPLERGMRDNLQGLKRYLTSPPCRQSLLREIRYFSTSLSRS